MLQFFSAGIVATGLISSIKKECKIFSSAVIFTTRHQCRFQNLDTVTVPQLRIIQSLFCPVRYLLMELRFVSISDKRINITEFDRGHWISAPKGIFNLTDKSIVCVAEAKDMKEFRYCCLSSLFARIGFSHTTYLISSQFSNISNHPGQLDSFS